jgi:hypothetical protein
MADLVDDEVVEIPFPPALHVRPPGLRRNLRRVLPTYQVGELVEAVDDRRLQERVADAVLRLLILDRPIADRRSRRLRRLRRLWRLRPRAGCAEKNH